MVSLPASIEGYLQEAGFSSTELLILKRLLEGEALTLRELASKTGKSTGVLDQATKKLIDRQIVSKESINDSMKYAISSLESINKWMEKDMAQRHAVLDRKRQDFEAFISTVEHESGRPEMEYFEGLGGIERAFGKLLAKEEKEWLHFMPALMREEDDPLLEYRVNMFRERRNKKAFMRVLSPDVPLGRRYQSRDIFEYRDSRLVPPDVFPVAFEQYIVGDTVACIDMQEQRASFIRYPAHADGQRKLFEIMWCQAGMEGDAEECALNVQARKVQEANMETKVFSGLREFFMSKNSKITFAILGVVAAAMTWGLYVNNARINTERIRERVKAIATTGVYQFDPNDINVLRSSEDVSRLQYSKIVRQLMQIQQQNDDIMFTYLLRPTTKDSVYEFIAASDGLDPFAEIDANGDGVIDEADEIVKPGDEYDITEMDALYPDVISRPSVNSESYTDQWGTFITGYAPIYNDDGTLNSILSVDMNAGDIQSLTLQTFRPTLYFLGIFLLFVAIRLAAFHRSLFQELLQLSRTKEALAISTFCALIALAITGVMYKYTLELMKDEISTQLLSVVATSAPEISISHINAISGTAEDMKKEEYQLLYEKLNEVRAQNQHLNLQYAYIMRPSIAEGMYEFVADADSNYFLPDLNNPDAPEVVPPGTQYAISQLAQAKEEGQLLEMPLADQEVTTDKWGTYLSASAPIMNKNGEGIAIIGVDMDIGEFYERVDSKFRKYIWFFTLWSVILSGSLVYKYKKFRLFR